MSVYIGTLGRLVELPYVTASSITPAERYTFTETLEGRVKAQVRTVGRRVWSLSASRYLAQAQGALMSFINGEWGNGPFVWVSSDAPVTNMLTPEVSTCGPQGIYGNGATIGPPVEISSPLGAGVWAGRSILNNPAETLYFSDHRNPMLPGRPVTGSAWVMGAGSRVRLHWYGANGAGMGVANTSSATGSASRMTRLSVTAIPPAGAVACGVSAIATIQATRPALTWTNVPFDWADGQGCLSAVVHGVLKDVQSAHLDPNGFRAADMSFTITEVG